MSESNFIGVTNMKFRIFTAIALAGLTLWDVQAKADDQFDMAMEAIVASDGMAYGLTYTDHKPNYSISISPSYGIFYGNFFIENLNYGSGNPIYANLKASVGATPTFGALAVDFNLQRRIKPGDATGAANRWLPYVTGTYTFSDQLSTSLGAGYYSFDDASLTKSFWEIYGAVDLTPVEGLKLHAEASYDPKSDFGNNDYLELVGSAKVTLPSNFELVGKIGYEDYIQGQLPNYTWYEAGINYNFNEHATLGLKAHGNNLSAADCPAQAYTDCSNSIFASLTIRGKVSDLHK
jgi:hypothetical protein